MLDLQEMPFVKPANLLLKKMIPDSIDGLLLQIANLPRVHESTIHPSTLTTLACKIGAHQLSHPIGEMSEAFMVGVWRKNIPISVTLCLVLSADAGE